MKCLNLVDVGPKIVGLPKQFWGQLVEPPRRSAQNFAK